MDTSIISDERRREANQFVAAAVRNNTSIEHLHANGQISQSEMKQLIIEICSNVHFLLAMRDVLEREQYEAVLQLSSIGSAAGWDTETRIGLWQAFLPEYFSPMSNAEDQIGD